MKIELSIPDVVRISVHQDKDDPHYGSCLWAYFDFDLERYMLNIQSDCGNAAYRWHETPKTESFLELMARIGDDYLIHKLFGRPAKVNVEQTIEEVREFLGIGEDESCRDDDLTDREREEREEALEELETLLYDVSDCYSAAQRELVRWNDEHEFEIDCIYEHVIAEYTADQKAIAKIFRDYVQPKIRKLLKSSDYQAITKVWEVMNKHEGLVMRDED